MKITKNTKKLPYIPDRPFWILIIRGSGSGKTNALLDLVKEQDGFDKIYCHAKDISQPKYDFLIKKCEYAGIKHFNDLNAFIECSNAMDGIYENIGD